MDVDRTAYEWADEGSTAADLLELMEPKPWANLAACKSSSNELFFPLRGEDRKIVEAKKICQSCPVADECLADHIDEMHGVWGGTSAKERQKLRSQRRAKLAAEGVAVKGRLATCGTDGGYYGHRYRGQTPCEACRAAHSKAELDRQKRRRQGFPAIGKPAARRERDVRRRDERKKAGFCYKCADGSHAECRGNGCACTVPHKIAQLPVDHAVKGSLASHVPDSCGPASSVKASPLGEDLGEAS